MTQGWTGLVQKSIVTPEGEELPYRGKVRFELSDAITELEVVDDSTNEESVIRIPRGGSGQSIIKEPVRLAFTDFIPSYTRVGNVITFDADGVLQVDGENVVADDRVLLPLGADPEDAGIYLVSYAGDVSNPAVLVRAIDADESDEFSSGMRVPVLEGDTNAGLIFELATDTDPIVLNATPLSFVVQRSVIAGALVNELRAQIATAPVGSKLFLRGYTTPGDGGEGTFTVVANGTDDDGTVLVGAGFGAMGKAAVRDAGPRTVRQFGAVGNGVANDTQAIARALAALKAVGGGELIFPLGTYLTDPINLQGPSGGDWANIKLKGETRRSATAGGSIIQARAGTGGGAPATQTYLFRAAGQSIRCEDLTFDGNFACTTAVVFYDYQSVGSGLERCFVTRTHDFTAVTVTPDHTGDVFNAVGHPFVNGDRIYIRTTATLPTEIYQPVVGPNSGTFNWVWYVVNKTNDTFQISLTAAGAAFAFSDNGSGVITARKYASASSDPPALIRIGGASGLQADTGTIRDCNIIHDITDFTRIAPCGILISDENALLWDIQKTHIQSFVDGIYVRGGGCSVRECTLFPLSSVSRAHFVKDGVTQGVLITDETATEMDAVPWIVVVGSQAVDYAQPWVVDGCFVGSGRAHINWDCRQPLILRGQLGGDVNITATGGQYVNAISVTFPIQGDVVNAYNGALAQLVRIGSTDRNGYWGNRLPGSLRLMAADTSDSVAGITGPVLSLEDCNPAGLTSAADQALVYNDGGIVHLQGHSGIRGYIGTVLKLLLSTANGCILYDRILSGGGGGDMSYRGPWDGDGNYAARFQGYNGSAWQTAVRVGNQGGGNVPVWIAENGGALRFFDTNAGATKQAVTGALTAVADANAKAVLQSILAALTAYGLLTNSTT